MGAVRESKLNGNAVDEGRDGISTSRLAFLDNNFGADIWKVEGWCNVIGDGELKRAIDILFGLCRREVGVGG